ncbi:monocyte chemotactic protein 1B-like [Hoplias malabaricus]|uniref:monocyte chemotactic protein 1B-like n=1 Tax=Hoplias malabaricus TaxID=27720 RepID=UPI00346359A2
MRNLFVLMMALICSLQLVSSIPVGLRAEDCCTKLSVLNKIPVKHIVSYTVTHSNCPLKAVVLNMASGKRFCVNPDHHWVQSHMKTVDQRNPTTTTATH